MSDTIADSRDKWVTAVGYQDSTNRNGRSVPQAIFPLALLAIAACVRVLVRSSSLCMARLC
eukprot:592426-Amphidinium_carterae.2